MPAIEPLSRLLGIDPNNLSTEENLVLEIELFANVYETLTEHFEISYKNYFESTNETEANMIDEKFISYLINDILATGEYSLSGVAYYTQIPEEVLYDAAIGRNKFLSLLFSRKIMELHRNVRGELYQSIIKKIALEKMITE